MRSSHRWIRFLCAVLIAVVFALCRASPSQAQCIFASVQGSSTQEPEILAREPGTSVGEREAAPLPGRIPLAPGAEYETPLTYPRLRLGIGLRSFHPDLSGLRPVYGKTPSVPLSAVWTILLEVDVSRTLGIQFDGGAIFASDSTRGFHALCGPLVYPDLGLGGTWRPFVGGGLSASRYTATIDDYVTDGAATGWYVMAGLLTSHASDVAFQLYGGYSSSSPVSTDFYGGGFEPPVRVSADLSTLMIGIRVLW